jgi:hypothetical protein
MLESSHNGHNGQKPQQVWTFRPDDSTPYEEDESRLLNQDDELRTEIENMFGELESDSVEGGGEPKETRYEVHWHIIARDKNITSEQRTDWQDEERRAREKVKLYQGRPHGGKRKGAGRPKGSPKSRQHGGRRAGAGRPKNGVNGSHGQPEKESNCQYHVDDQALTVQ